MKKYYSFKWVSRVLLAAIVASGHLLGHAQATAPTDYLVTAAGDTLRGQLQLPRNVGGASVTLAGAGGAAHSYRAEESRGFGLVDGRRFVVRRVSFVSKLPVPAGPDADTQNSVAVFMQQLVQGPASLYRLDYADAANQQTAFTYTNYEKTFFYLQMPQSKLRLLQQQNFEPILKALFQNCPTATSHLRFEEANLVHAVLAYDADCSGQRGADLRGLANQATGAALHLGLRVGVPVEQVSYSDSQFLNNSIVQASAGFAVGVLIGTDPEKRFSTQTGLAYTARRSKGTDYFTVPVGFANQGQVLNLDQQVAVDMLQVPIIVNYGLTKTTVKPFLSAGIAPGVIISNRTVQTVLGTVYDPASFRNRQVGETLTADKAQFSKGLLLGYQLGGGISQRIGTRHLTIAAYFEQGIEAQRGDSGGHLQYQGGLLSIGIDL